MRNYTRSIWTCAALYAAIGLIGIVFLTTRPGVATSNDGYGIGRLPSVSGTASFDTRMKSTATKAVMSATV